jgi:hypothetical protein
MMAGTFGIGSAHRSGVLHVAYAWNLGELIDTI